MAGISIPSISIPSIPSVSFPGFTAPTLPPVLAATPTLPGGLPSIPGGLPTPPAAVSLDTVTVTAQKQPEGWGIYLQNDKVISPDSIVSLEYRREWRIADYPQELGAFQSYNKVMTPFDVRVRMTKGGNAATRGEFLDAVEAIAGSLDLYNVVTPDQVYTSVNIVSIGYSRTAHQGLGLVSVDIGLRQIRVTAKQKFANVKAPAAQAPISGGTVSATALSALQSQAVKRVGVAGSW